MFTRAQHLTFYCVLSISTFMIVISYLYPKLRYGLLGDNLLIIFAFLLISFHLSAVIISIYLHRSETHRCVHYKKPLRHFFRLWLWLFTGLNRPEWVAVHRLHHKFPDKIEDPHSPRNLGLKSMLLKSCEHYINAYRRKECKKLSNVTDNDWLERHVYGTKLGDVAGLIIYTVFFGLFGLPLFIISLMAIITAQFFFINGLGHHSGKRHYDTDDNSHNISRFGILLGGEELHHNHHYNPVSAKFSFQKGEFDMGWLYIRLFQSLRLAETKKIH